MYHVISEMQDRAPVYLVEDTETHERKRCHFDCERSAQAFADYLNEREGNQFIRTLLDWDHAGGNDGGIER